MLQLVDYHGANGYVFADSTKEFRPNRSVSPLTSAKPDAVTKRMKKLSDLRDQ